MATEYGVRDDLGNDDWEYLTRAGAETMCRETGWSLIAREVSEPRIVSIRA
jgi:hypothetical protein